jgi:hypothetical protein
MVISDLAANLALVEKDSVATIGTIHYKTSGL